MQQLPRNITRTPNVRTEHEGRVQKPTQWQVQFHTEVPGFNSCYFLPPYDLLATAELTLNNGDSGVISHTFLMSFIRWEVPQDRMERNIRRDTLIHRLILHRLKTLSGWREKFNPSKGCTYGQEEQEFEM